MVVEGPPSPWDESEPALSVGVLVFVYSQWSLFRRSAGPECRIVGSSKRVIAVRSRSRGRALAERWAPPEHAARSCVGEDYAGVTSRHTKACSKRLVKSIPADLVAEPDAALITARHDLESARAVVFASKIDGTPVCPHHVPNGMAPSAQHTRKRRLSHDYTRLWEA
jgi:hypothetical protein